MSDAPDPIISDAEITSDAPTEDDDNLDVGHGTKDSGDEPTEDDDNLDIGHGTKDSGDE